MLDFAVGLTDLVRKLPTFVQHRWDKLQFEYACFHHQEHPPFIIFTQFLPEQAAQEASRFYIDHPVPAPALHKPVSAKVLATVIEQPSTPVSKSSPASSSVKLFCVEHQAQGHHLTTCKKFLNHPIADRLSFVRTNHLCFSCLNSGHQSKDCQNHLSCEKCKNKHPPALHSFAPPEKDYPPQPKLPLTTALAEQPPVLSSETPVMSS